MKTEYFDELTLLIERGINSSTSDFDEEYSLILLEKVHRELNENLVYAPSKEIKNNIIGHYLCELKPVIKNFEFQAMSWAMKEKDEFGFRNNDSWVEDIHLNSLNEIEFNEKDNWIKNRFKNPLYDITSKLFHRIHRNCLESKLDLEQLSLTHEILLSAFNLKINYEKIDPVLSEGSKDKKGTIIESDSQNKYPTIFRSRESYELFMYLVKEFSKINAATLSYFYHRMKDKDKRKSKIICDQANFIKFCNSNNWTIKTVKSLFDSDLGGGKEPLYDNLEDTFYKNRVK